MNLLKKYTSGQMDAAIDWLNRYAQTSDEEALHQFRVNLKKIHAVMQYFREKEIHSKKIKQLKRKEKEIFSDAGFIRDAGIRIQWLTKNHYYLLLKASSLETNHLLYCRFFSDKTKENKSSLKKIKEQLVLFCDEEKAASVFSYSEQLKEDIFKTINSAEKENWHHLRKQIKQLLYAYHWNRKEDQLKLLKVNELHYFDQLQDAIGAWHDAENLKEWFSNEQFFLSENVQVKNQFRFAWKKLLAEIEQKEKTINQLLKKKLKSE